MTNKGSKRALNKKARGEINHTNNNMPSTAAQAITNVHSIHHTARITLGFVHILALLLTY